MSPTFDLLLCAYRHPFTVASIPTPGPHPHTSKEMHLLIRQASGLTAKLVKALSKRESDTVPVLIDGPYGGVEGDLTLYEHVILIAGGTGITFVKPVLEWLLLQMQYTTTRTSTIEVVWSVRSAGELFSLFLLFPSPISYCRRR